VNAPRVRPPAAAAQISPTFRQKPCISVSYVPKLRPRRLRGRGLPVVWRRERPSQGAASVPAPTFNCRGAAHSIGWRRVCDVRVKTEYRFGGVDARHRDGCRSLGAAAEQPQGAGYNSAAASGIAQRSPTSREKPCRSVSYVPKLGSSRTNCSPSPGASSGAKERRPSRRRPPFAAERAILLDLGIFATLQSDEVPLRGSRRSAARRTPLLGRAAGAARRPTRPWLQLAAAPSNAQIPPFLAEKRCKSVSYVPKLALGPCG
jgi:hypothetical protein